MSATRKQCVNTFCRRWARWMCRRCGRLICANHCSNKVEGGVAAGHNLPQLAGSALCGRCYILNEPGISNA